VVHSCTAVELRLVGKSGIVYQHKLIPHTDATFEWLDVMPGAGGPNVDVTIFGFNSLETGTGAYEPVGQNFTGGGVFVYDGCLLNGKTPVLLVTKPHSHR